MTTVSNLEYSDFKEKVLAHKTARAQAALSEITFTDGGNVVLRGKEIALTNTAWKELVELVGVGKQLVGKFERELGKSAACGLLNAVSKALAGNSRTIELVADPASKKIIHCLPTQRGGVSNELFFDMFEQVAGNYPGLEIFDLHFNPAQGATISTVNRAWEFDVPGLSDEFFRTGMNFSNRIDVGLSVNPFNERLVCANGMVIRRQEKSRELPVLTDVTLERFLKEVTDKHSFRTYETSFIEQVRRMKKTRCSYAELEQAWHTVVETASAPEVKYELNKRIPLQDVIEDYKLNQIELPKLAQKFKKNAVTPVTVWELVNEITWLASHEDNELGITTEGRQQLQFYAGGLAMKKTFDVECLLPDIYRN